jgi:hypothetical protein
MSDRDRNPDDPLLKAASRLPGELPPERDLWPGIRDRLAMEAGATGSTPRAWSGWTFRFAAAAALVAATALVTLQLVREEPSAPLVGADTLEPARFGAAYDLGAKHKLARASLSRDLERHLQDLPTDTAAVVRRNLEQIRLAVSEINAALEEDPNNILLQQLLMAAYQDEMDVLVNVNRMATAVPSRNEI